MDTAYFSGMSPFRFTVRSVSNPGSTKNYYALQSWWPQKIFCAIQVFAGILYEIRTLLKYIPAQKQRKNPVKYFLFMSRILDTILNFLTLKKLWNHQKDFLRLVNLLSGDMSLPLVPSFVGMKSKFFAIVICGLYISMGMANWFFTTKAFATIYNPDGSRVVRWTFHSWWETMIDTGWEMLLTEKPKSKGTVEEEKRGSVFIRYLLGIFGALGFFQKSDSKSKISKALLHHA